MVPGVRADKLPLVLGSALDSDNHLVLLEPVRTRVPAPADVGAYGKPGQEEQRPVVHVLVVCVGLAAGDCGGRPGPHGSGSLAGCGGGGCRGRRTVVELLLLGSVLPALVRGVPSVHDISNCNNSNYFGVL